MKLVLPAILICLLLGGNVVDSGCPGGGGGGGSGGGTGRAGFGPGLMPLLQTISAGVESWEVWWSRNRDSYLKFRQPIEWIKRLDTGGSISITKYPEYEKLVKLLSKAVLEESNPSIVSNAAIALAKSGDDRAPEILKKAYEKQTHILVRNNVLLALGMTGKTAGVNLLKEALLDKKVGEVRRGFAALALGYINDPEVIKFLEEFVTQKNDTEVVGSAALALGNLKDAAAVPILAKLLNPAEGDPKLDRRARVWITLALGRIGTDAAWKELKKIASDKDDEVRAGVAIGLGMINLPGSPRLLSDLMQDRSMITRGFAAISLARLARSAATAQPVSGSRETSPSEIPGTVKSAAVSSLCDELIEAYRRTKNIEPEGMIILALGLLGDERAEPFIRKLLTDRRTRLTLKGATALSLGLLKDTEALEDLLTIAQKQQDEPVIIPHITLALGMLGNEKSVEMLVKLWDKAQKNVFGVAYTNIAVALTMLGKRDEIVLPRLRKDCAKDADISIRPFALHTLGLVGTRETAQIFIDLYENETNDNIRNAVVYSIGFFMDKSPAPLVTRIMADNNHSLFTWVMQHLLPMPQW